MVVDTVPSSRPQKPPVRRRLVKGNEAVALGAVAAGADAFFGYPITPQNEIPEILSGILPRLRRVFLQAESEVASINMVYGAAAAGHRAMTSSSSPGISLMMEGISYIAGARLPCLIVNVMRGGPGLGNIAPSQSDYFQACKGGGHGDYRSLVLAPWNVQEMYDFPAWAFDLADTYRMPSIILADAVLGQMQEAAEVAEEFAPPPMVVKTWATCGRGRRPHKNVVNSLWLDANDLCRHNEAIQAAFARARREVRWDERYTEDADHVVVAFGSAARLALGAIQLLRQRGYRLGLLRPITLSPFPRSVIANIAERVSAMSVFELNCGQMVEDVERAVGSACPVEFFGKAGGVLPPPEELAEVFAHHLHARPRTSQATYDDEPAWAAHDTE